MSDARIKQFFSLEGPTMDWFLREDLSLDEREELATAARVALGTDSLSDINEILPDPDSTDRRGWWADMEADIIWGGWPIGCKNWLLSRAKITELPSQEGSTLERARRYTVNALQSFIDKRIASRVDVEVFRTELNRIEVHAIIYRGPEFEIDLRYQLLWKEDAILENVAPVVIPPNVLRRVPFRALTLSPVAPTLLLSNHLKPAAASGNLLLSSFSPDVLFAQAAIRNPPQANLSLSRTLPSISMIGGNDIYTKILLHMNGAHLGTVFPDNNIGGSAHTWTSVGGITSTAVFKFGTAAAYFNGTTIISTPDHNDFTLGSADWTVDCWFNVSGGAGTYRYIFGQMNSTSMDRSASIHLCGATDVGGNINCLSGVVSNGSTLFFVKGTTAFTTAGWHHVAFVRTGNVLKLFVDGVQEGGDVAYVGAIQNATGNFAIGRPGDYPSQNWVGSIDEFRLSVGIARWTTNFTPPTFAWG